MGDIIIENIIATTNLDQEVDVEELAKKMPDATYDPDDFMGLVFHFSDPKTDVLLFPSGKIICTGAKKLDVATEKIQQVFDKLKEQDISVSSPSVEIMNIIASLNLETPVPLDIITKKITPGYMAYQPKEFPGAIYHYDDHIVFLIFPSGKIVCTGVKSFEETVTAFGNVKDKLLSIIEGKEEEICQK